MSPATHRVTGLIVVLALAPGVAAAQRVREPVGPRLVPLTLNNAGPAPTGLRVSPGPNSIRLSWVCTAGATGYEVFATPAGGAPVKLTPTPLGTQCYQDVSQNLNQDPRLVPATAYITSFVHGGLTPLAEYGYSVRALYPGGYADSPGLTARTILWPAPVGLAVQLNGRTVALTWIPMAGAPGYLVYRQSSGQAGFQQVNPAPVPTAPFQDTPPPGTNLYAVEAVSGNRSAPVSVVVGRPLGVSVSTSREYNGTNDFTWFGTADATGVTLVRATSPAGPYVPTKYALTARNQWARDSPTPEGVALYYKVLADYKGLVLESDVVTVPQGITKLGARVNGTASVILSWTCDPGATGYHVTRQSGSSFVSTDPYVAALPGTTTCQYLDSNLLYASGKLTYTYVLKAQYAVPGLASVAAISVTVP